MARPRRQPLREHSPDRSEALCGGVPAEVVRCLPVRLRGSMGDWDLRRAKARTRIDHSTSPIIGDVPGPNAATLRSWRTDWQLTSGPGRVAQVQRRNLEQVSDAGGAHAA
jgi:hypothetical protein